MWLLSHSLSYLKSLGCQVKSPGAGKGNITPIQEEEDLGNYVTVCAWEDHEIDPPGMVRYMQDEDMT